MLESTVGAVPGAGTTDSAERDVREAVAAKPWQPYLDAVLGFRNHWYPAYFGAELAEGAVVGVRLLGEPILLKRVAGQVYAVSDRCAHRGVPFSTRPECYTENTVTCWYHGFTYDVRDGRLVAVVTDPASGLIGKVRLRSYPVEERQGLVFVFVGDLTPTPPLSEDVQPGFLDADLAVVPEGERTPVNSNWRLAAENGFDASHIYIHRNSPLVVGLKRALPLATIIASREGMVVAEPGKPKGVVKGSGKRTPIWEMEIEGVKVGARFPPGAQAEGSTGPAPRTSPDTSMWMPCGLKVDPFPIPGIIQFEWYVPIDETSHMYFMTWGRRVGSADEANQFFQEMETTWKRQVVEDFNSDDVTAREAMQRFYADEEGWTRERLFRPDLIITEWRKLVSVHNRGIQRREHAAGTAGGPSTG